MPAAGEALRELADVFKMIEHEYLEQHKAMPRDTTEIVNA